MKTFFKQSFLITGAFGFVGLHLSKLLKKNLSSASQLRCVHSSEYDLREMEHCKEVVKDIDVVIHLAARVGGIGYNQRFPAELFYDNAIIGIQLMEAARKAGVKKFVNIGTVCSYPKFTPSPFKEEDLWNGYPEETNAPYGLAKKMSIVQSQAYRQQYGFNSITLLPVNMYGPGDHIHPTHSHVIPALISKFTEAKQKKHSKVEIWGTGNATREFLYISDAVKGILLASELYDASTPVNLGSNEEISIRALAEKISQLMDYKGELVFDTSKPDGQPRRKVDTSKAEQLFGFVPSTKLETGLKKTIRWYEKKYTS